MQTVFLIGFVVSVWWGSTAAAFWLVNRPFASRNRVAVFVSAVTLVAHGAVIALRGEESITGVCAGFGIGVALWAWHEIMFLFGFSTGPRCTSCPQGLGPWRRFVVSAETVAFHQLGIALHAAILLALSWNAANSVAAQTFLILWLMRILAKLIIYFGAPNISVELMPVHMRYLESYFRKPANGVALVLTLAAAWALAAFLGFQTAVSLSGSFREASFIILTTLAIAAVFEHAALVLRIPDHRLWSWLFAKTGGGEGAELISGRTKP